MKCLSLNSVDVCVVDFDIFRDSILSPSPMIRLTRAFMAHNFELSIKEQALKFGEFIELSNGEYEIRIVEVRFGPERGPIYFLISDNCSENHKSVLSEFILFIERSESVLASSEFLKDFKSSKFSPLPVEPIWLFKGVGFSIVIPNYTALSFKLLSSGEL